MNVNNYCHELGQGEAMDNAIDKRKNALMKNLDNLDIHHLYNILHAVVVCQDVLRPLLGLVKSHYSDGRVRLDEVEDLVSHLSWEIENSIEKLAEQQIKQEWGLS